MDFEKIAYLTYKLDFYYYYLMKYNENLVVHINYYKEIKLYRILEVVIKNKICIINKIIGKYIRVDKVILIIIYYLISIFAKI